MEMSNGQIFEALDGLLAYDTGDTDMGIHDDLLKQKVKDALVELCVDEERSYCKLLDEYLKELLDHPDAGVADAKEFIEWLEDEMGIS